MKTIKTVLLLVSVALFTACSSKEDLSGIEDIPGLGGDTWAKTPLDKWLYDSLVVPYNIATKYKWDQFEYDLDKTLVPPDEQMVIPTLQAIKKVWIDTYIAEAGELFIRRYSPKFLILCGSASWNVDARTVTLGTAEGGRKIVIYSVNSFRSKDTPGYTPSDSATLKQIFHVIEHEFGHILHQTVLYTPTFKNISAGRYTANWNNISDTTARSNGFVSAYAMSAYDEDFVEMISLMMTEGKDGFDRIVESIPPGISESGVTQAQAKAALRQKEAIIVDYFRTAWKIDYRSLQARTRKAVEDLIY
jgi:substrate import-associated zinc metallohydrolase lipoprotein